MPPPPHRLQVRNMVDASALRDIAEASPLEGYALPKMYRWAGWVGVVRAASVCSRGGGGGGVVRARGDWLPTSAAWSGRAAGPAPGRRWPATWRRVPARLPGPNAPPATHPSHPALLPASSPASLAPRPPPPPPSPSSNSTLHTHQHSPPAPPTRPPPPWHPARSTTPSLPPSTPACCACAPARTARTGSRPPGPSSGEPAALRAAGCGHCRAAGMTGTPPAVWSKPAGRCRAVVRAASWTHSSPSVCPPDACRVQGRPARRPGRRWQRCPRWRLCRRLPGRGTACAGWRGARRRRLGRRLLSELRHGMKGMHPAWGQLRLVGAIVTHCTGDWSQANPESWLGAGGKSG